MDVKIIFLYTIPIFLYLLKEIVLKFLDKSES